MYLAVYCDYEGIGAIFQAGEAAWRAREVVLALRERISANAAKDDDARWALPSPWSDMDEPDRICVRKPNNEGLFVCCCAELDVAPAERVLM